MRLPFRVPRRPASVALLLVLMSAPVRAVPVEVELSLLVDTSGSISEAEYRLQIDSYADLVRDPDVIPQDASVAINLVLFASSAAEAVPWTLVDGPVAADALSDAIRNTPRQSGMTALGDGLLAASATFADNGFEGVRRVIDVSGDGVVNAGTPIRQARTTTLARVDVVNGLAITAEVPTLGDYFRDEVVGGDGAFAFEVVDSVTFGQALRVKLRRETGGCLPPPDGLLGWWPLDEPSGPLACDSAGRRRGMHVGCPTPVDGFVAGGLAFDGVDDAVRIASLAADLSQATTMLAWIRVATGGTLPVAELRDDATGAALALVVRDGVAVAIAAIASNGGSLAVQELGGGPALHDDGWHLVAVVAEAGVAGGWRLLVDGVVVAAADLPADAMLPARGSVTLGEAETLAPGARLLGILDEVQVAGRILTDDEVAAIFAAGEGGECNWSPACATSGGGLLAEGCLWPPNHRYVCFTDLTALAPQLAEAGDVRVLACTSSQPDDETGVGDGRSADDCVVLPDATGFCLRSERQGVDRAGRSYLITVGAVDGCGGAVEGFIRLGVPHDMRGHDDCVPADPQRFLLPWEAPGAERRAPPRRHVR